MTLRTPAERLGSPVALATELRDAITRISRRLRQTRPIGELTIAQLSALHSLDAAGAMTPSELADVERVQPPTMTRVVARLEERSLVQRSPHPTDRRQVVLAATPQGRRLIAENRRIRDEWLARRLSVLSAEERDIVRRAAQIMNRIAKE